MARNRILGLLAACAFTTAGSLLTPLPALAVNVTDNFELDGNVTTEASGKPDWQTANFAAVAPPLLAKSGVVADPAPLTIFATGGSKDDLNITSWKYKNGSVPDKDNIVNAYAVAYNVNSDLVIYAGAERFDNSGDAFIGFWFFQKAVDASAPFTGGAGLPFVGEHAIGDTLVLANFTNGGTTVNIEILKWVGTGGNVNGTLQRIAGIAGGTPAKCGAGAPDNFCGITNAAAGESPPWTFLNKDGGSSFQVANFFEVGINITQVFKAVGDGSTPCFSAFMAETRASSSVDATLKDFVLHSFPVCGIAVTKQCKDPVLASGTTVGYTVEGQVQNTGFGTLTNLLLTDAPRALGNIGYYACTAGGLPTGSPIGFSGSLNALASVCYRSSFTTPINGEDDTITASASTGSATVTAQATADCPNLQLSPELSVTKNCATTLAAVAPYLVVQVNVDGSVCNVQKTGSIGLTGVTVTDTDVSGNLPLKDSNGVVGNTLAVGECRTFTASYFPPVATNRLDPPNNTLVPGLAKFSDTVTANGTAPFSTVTPQTATANCTLCPTCTTAGDQCTGNSCPASTGATQTRLLIRTK